MRNDKVFGEVLEWTGRRRRRLVLRIAAVALALDAFVLGLGGLSVSESLHHHYLRAEVEASNLSAILAQAVGGTLDRIDFALTVIADAGQSSSGGGGSARLEDVLHSAREQVPEAEFFRVAGPDGQIPDAVGPNGAAVSMQDRDYFRTLRDDPAAGLVISSPLQGRISRRWVVVLARRISAPDGSFMGVAYASLPIQVLTDIFTTVDLGDDDAIALRGPLPGLGAIARFPDTVGGQPAAGNPSVSRELQDATANHPLKGLYRARAGIDGIERVLGFHRVGSYPYYLLVGLSTDQMRRLWWRDSAKTLALCGLFLALSMAGALFVYVALRTRQRLRGRLELIEFAFDHQAEAVLLLHRDGAVVYGNMAAASLFERHRSELPATRVWDLSMGIASETWPDHWLAVAGDGPVTVNTWVRRRDGSEAPVVVTSNYLGFDGQEFDVAIIREVGEQLRYERQLRQALLLSEELGEALARKNEDLERFAEILAHHMQEPVRQQHIFAQHLARLLPEPMAPEVRQSLDAIRDAARRHLTLLNDAQLYLSFDAMNPLSPPHPADPALHSALDRLGPQIAATGAVVESRPLPALPMTTAALEEVFTVLIENALTYHRPDAPPRVTVAAETRDGRTVVTVTDDGPGIPAPFHDRVFRVFERLDPADGKPGGGIGLALARKIVEAAGGRIWIEQPEGRGTRVCFTVAGEMRME